jgi:hypothetical protein
MPIYSSKYLGQMISPAWRLIVLELSLYTRTVIFNGQIQYEEEEQYKMEDEGHNYTRGYESDDEDDKYGMEGLILELIDFAIDLLKRRSVMSELKGALLTFLLCIKGYCLMPYNSILLWQDDPNLYISEEYDDENINTVRNKSLNMIKEITKEMDDTSILQFLRIIISEFTEGIKIENYTEVLKLDDYNFLIPYFEEMNTINDYVYRRHEANLLILGTLSDDLIILHEKSRISKEEINELIKFLFSIISNPTKGTSILVGRAIWCVSRLISLVKYEEEIMKEIFESVSVSLTHPESDLSIKLVSSQCLTTICLKLPKEKTFESRMIESNYIQWIKLMEEANEDTLMIPIDAICAMSIINKEQSLYVPLNASKLFVETYSKYYNHPVIGSKILDLIKIWCQDKRSAKVLISLFVPFAIFVFDDFFKGMGKGLDSAFEDIKRTVINTHGNNDLDIKTSSDMLPVKYIV